MKCYECGKEIPEYRLKAKRKIVTCSKECSNKRNTTPSHLRNKSYIFNSNNNQKKKWKSAQFVIIISTEKKEENVGVNIVDIQMIQIGGKMVKQEDRKKREVTSYPSEYEDYENGKIRDKKQKKLKEFMRKEWE